MASISHELRTPLTSILGYGELLEETALDSKQQEYLDRMLHSSKYLLSLVGDFLDIVKLEKNDIRLEQREVRLHTVLSECADLIKTNLQPDVSFDTNIPFLHYTILADERRIKQVILNILSNAAKFTSQGMIKFHVTDIKESDHHVTIEISIEDTGIGMSPEIQKSLFDPFVTSDSTQGFGLGLYISKEIIKLMDGEIIATSEEGKGTTFTLSFTVQKAQEKYQKQTLSGKKILMLSERDDIQTATLKSILHTFHASLDCYHSDNNTLKMLNELTTEYDIIILNIHTFTSTISHMLSTLKSIHPSIKSIGIIEGKALLQHTNFDKIIQGFPKPETLVFELEAFCANSHAIPENFMDFSHLRVLIVEDVEMNYTYIRQMLSASFSIECDLAVNGHDAVEQIRTHTYDVVFMDIRMPVMNGYEATRAIRKFNQKVPIVCMSADVYAKDIETAKSAGMNSFISKPLDKHKIKQIFLDLGSSNIRSNSTNVSHTLKKEYGTDHFIIYDPMALKERAYQHLGELFNDETVIVNLLKKAIESIEKYLDRIQQNKVEHDIDALIDDIHAMKGVLSNLGLTEASVIAGEIQKRFQSGEISDAYKIKNDFIQNITYFVTELKKDIG